MATKFGARLAARRQAAGLSQAALAEKSSVSLRTIGNHERGTADLREPNSRTVRRLAQVLGCTVGELLDEEGEAGR